MAEYDPKRRRRTPAANDDAPAAVDALLEAVEHPVTASETGARTPVAAAPGAPDAGRARGVTPSAPAGSSPSPRPAPVRDISPVPAPAPGTGARSLVLVAAAAAVGAIVTLLVVVRLLGRRRRR